MCDNEVGRAIFDPDHMILNARSLRRVAMGLDGNASEAQETDEVRFRGIYLAAPILWALATEIALKAWQCREWKGKPCKSHDLLRLYEALEPTTQTLLADWMSGEELQLPGPILKESEPGDSALRKSLRYHRDTFERWRYYYENPRKDFYTFLDPALKQIIDAYVERWGDSARTR